MAHSFFPAVQGCNIKAHPTCIFPRNGSEIRSGKCILGDHQCCMILCSHCHYKILFDTLSPTWCDYNIITCETKSEDTIEWCCRGSKFTDEQYTTINQSTAECFDPRVFVIVTCKQLTKTLGSKCPAVDWLIVVYCSSVNFATWLNINSFALVCPCAYKHQSLYAPKNRMWGQVWGRHYSSFFIW